MKWQTKIRALLACSSVLLTTACVPSLYPLYTAEDLTVDPAVVGTWIDDDEATWTLERSSGSSYGLTIVEDGVSADFSAHLVQLGGHARAVIRFQLRVDDRRGRCERGLQCAPGAGHRFLDIYPEDDALPDHGFFQFHVVPAHTFWKVSLDDETLRLVGLDLSWLEDELESGAVAVTHSLWGNDNGTILLTAKTRELQGFVVAHADNTEAFSQKRSDDTVVELRRP